MEKITPKLMVIVTIFLVLIACFVAFFIYKKKQQAAPSLMINTTHQATLGNPNAKIHIVAFEDLKCINCKLYNETIYPKLKRKYIDTSLAKYTVIPLAFMRGSMPAANAAKCLYQQNPAYFFAFVDYVYKNQPDESQDWATLPRLLDFATKATPKANLNKLSECIAEGRYTHAIDKNLEQALKLLHNQVATPAIFINGKHISELTFEEIEKLIKAAK